MTEKEKNLLLKDLCARLPYGVKIKFNDGTDDIYNLDGNIHGRFTENLIQAIEDLELKPYLRPMSSMTKEEKSDLQWIVLDETDGYCTNDAPYYTGNKIVYLDNIPDYIDFMCEHHLDYRGLIEKGLAFEAPENMYNN